MPNTNARVVSTVRKRNEAESFYNINGDNLQHGQYMPAAREQSGEHLYQEPVLPPTPPSRDQCPQRNNYSNFSDTADGQYENISETASSSCDTEYLESGEFSSKDCDEISEQPKPELSADDLLQSRFPRTFSLVYENKEAKGDDNEAVSASLNFVPQVKLLDKQDSNQQRTIIFIDKNNSSS